jgi:hypothetical protein
VFQLPYNRGTTYTGIGLFVLGALVVLAGGWGALPQDGHIATTLAGVALWAVGLVLLCLLCRCQKCEYRLFWHAVGKRDHSDGLLWFATAQECPRCGSRPRVASQPKS